MALATVQIETDTNRARDTITQAEAVAKHRSNTNMKSRMGMYDKFPDDAAHPKTKQ